MATHTEDKRTVAQKLHDVTIARDALKQQVEVLTRRLVASEAARERAEKDCSDLFHMAARILLRQEEVDRG